MSMSSSEDEISRVSHMHAEEDEEEEDTDEEEEKDISDVDDKDRTIYPKGVGSRRGFFIGRVIDPRAKWVQEWNRVFLLVCGMGLFVDPLFFYALSISDTCMCLFVDGWFAMTVTALRCMTDALHLWNMFLQLRTAKRSHGSWGTEADRTRITSPRSVAFKYLKAKKGFLLDLFVLLPVPQVVLWIIVPSLLNKGHTTLVMTVLLIVFLFQYLPKIYHSVCFLRQMQNLSGYIFGTVWWGISLNMIAYFVTANAAGDVGTC